MRPDELTADELIARWALAPHPEGGWYRRLYASALSVRASARERAAVTTIVYLLRAGERSRWHRVANDELWHFYGGAPLTLLRADRGFSEVEELRLGAAVQGEVPMHPIPAGSWQAAESTGAYSLVGCTVAPGFDFEDFTLLAHDAAAAARLRERWPGWSAFL